MCAAPTVARRHQPFWNWSYGQLLAVTWVLGTDPGPLQEQQVSHLASPFTLFFEAESLPEPRAHQLCYIGRPKSQRSSSGLTSPGVADVPYHIWLLCGS